MPVHLCVSAVWPRARAYRMTLGIWTPGVYSLVLLLLHEEHKIDGWCAWFPESRRKVYNPTHHYGILHART